MRKLKILICSFTALLLPGIVLAVAGDAQGFHPPPIIVWNELPGGPLSAIPPPVRTTGPSSTPAVDRSDAGADCGAPADELTRGSRLVVTIPGAPSFTVGDIPATSWARPPSTDPSWRLKFQSLLWMKPLARRAGLDGNKRALRALVAQTVAFHRQNPDPGSDADGWDEGTALRRLETENCLYAISRSPSLIPGMEADAGVLLGDRYYGPPYRRVHNHGLFANLRLIQAAALLDRPDWRATATRRMISEVPYAFSAEGVTNEQSSMYQGINANLWRQAERRLTGPAADLVRSAGDDAYRAFGWMTEPDGNIVQIGDSYEGGGRPISVPGIRTLRDDKAGWIIGRWSWTDPMTSYYTVRYGPARSAHGHHDQAGGVTWTTRGVRVLVGPGIYTYDTDNALNRYGIGPEGHNVAIPDGGTPGVKAAKVTEAGQNATTAWCKVKDRIYGMSHTRDIRVLDDLARFEVADSFPTGSSWRQVWHLDSLWTIVSATDKKAVFSHPSGRRLTVSTTGRIAAILRGDESDSPHGWHFPAPSVKVPAAEIVIRNVGGNSSTTFKVS
ncbi:heparinase II/III domain-containing protein [Actinoplanes sp. CA-051413]|uniref:heparinase II/III domain-containing protein n=1 Tax=Actinoplanes sp. CA-051413 TaxID=3239899 RepID=UPI003D97F1E3